MHDNHHERHNNQTIQHIYHLATLFSANTMLLRDKSHRTLSSKLEIRFLAKFPSKYVYLK